MGIWFTSTLNDIAILTRNTTPPGVHQDRLEHHRGWYTWVLLGLLGGYLLFDRAFAHLHIPGTSIFVAEPVLALGLVMAAGSAEGRRLVRYSPPVRALVGFMLWGAILLLFHVFEHGIDAIQDSSLWYYGLFAVVTGSLILSRQDSLERLIPVYAAALMAFAVIGWVRLSLSDSGGAAIPDTLVPWTSHRPGNIAIHAAIGFAFVVLLLGPWLSERFDRSTALAMSIAPAVGLLILYVGAGTQNRGGLVAGFIVLAGVPLVRRSFGPMIAVLSLALLLLLSALYITEASIDLGRRDLSVRQLINNIGSVTEGDDNGRVDFWKAVVDDVLSDSRAVIGLGFGENLGDRYGFTFGDPNRPGRTTAEAAGVNPLRNVHNSHLNVLARMGLIGAGAWVILWGLWYYHLFRARARLRMVDSPMRAAYLGWAMLAMTALLLNAFFDGTIEGPQVGVWAWTIFGLGAAVALEANMREWQRRREGSREIAREGGGSNPLDLPLPARKGRRR